MGAFANKKLQEEGIDSGVAAKKALHKTKDFFKKPFGKKKKKDKKEGGEEHEKSGVSFEVEADYTDNEEEEEVEEEEASILNPKDYRLREGRNVFLYYRMANMLGAGSYGEVWKAVQRETGSHRAIKVIKKADLASNDA